MGLADLHIHSIYSWDGTATISAILKYAVSEANLDLIAITDHDEIRGALEARDLASKYGIEVVPGSEISTADGHLLALFIDQKVPAGLPLAETVLHVADLGGICIAAHPGSKGAKSLNAINIHYARRDPTVAQTLVGVETLNSSLIVRRSFQAAEAIALIEGMAWVGNSDAHTLSMIGTAATQFPGTTTEDLRRALISRKTQVHHHLPQSPFKIMSHWLKGFLLRTAGWVAWNPYPEAPVMLGRTARVGIEIQN